MSDFAPYRVRDVDPNQTRHGFPDSCPLTGKCPTGRHCTIEVQCEHYGFCGQYCCLHPSWQEGAPRCTCGNVLIERWDGVERRLVPESNSCRRCHRESRWHQERLFEREKLFRP